MSTISKFDNDSVRKLNEAVLVALKAVAAEHGLTVSRPGGTYLPNEMSCKVTFCVKSETDDILNTPEALNFKRQCLGTNELQPSDLGTTFKNGGNTYRIIGWKPRARRGEIIVEVVGTGKRWRWEIDNVLKALGRPFKTDAERALDRESEAEMRAEARIS